MGIDVPDKISKISSFLVKQGSSVLGEYKSESRIYSITNLCDEITYGNNQDMNTLDLFADNTEYLIFKLSDGNSGRRVKNISSGQYLVAVPEEWEIKDKCLDSVIVTKVTNFRIDNYKALIIEISKSSGQIEFTTENGSVTLPTSLSQFKLIGEEINSIADKSPLFASPPELCSIKSDDSWKDVSWINLVEEGKIDGNRWHKEVPKSLMNSIVPLKDILSEFYGGWFSARLYNRNNDLIESLTFRYLTGLKSIDIQPYSIFPSENNNPIRIEIRHKDNIQCNVNASANVKSEANYNGTIVSLPVDFQEESVPLELSTNNSKTINVKIPIELIWWAEGNKSSKPAEWNKETISLDRNDFNHLENRFLIRLPWKGWKGSISMRLDEGWTISYRPTKSDDYIPIQFKDIVDKVMDAEIGLHSLILIAKPDNSKKQDTEIASFTVYAKCNHCDMKYNNVESLLKHIEYDCLDNYFPELTYDEYKQRYPELPDKICVCPFCGFYSDSNRHLSPDRRIDKHITKECKKNLLKDGTRKESYSYHTDMDDIRKYVKKSLPKIVKCELCGETFENPDEKTLIAHLTVNHSSEFCNNKC